MAALGCGCRDGVAPQRLRLLMKTKMRVTGRRLVAVVECRQLWHPCGRAAAVAGIRAPVLGQLLYFMDLGVQQATDWVCDVLLWPSFQFVVSCFRWWVLFGRLHGGYV